MGERDSAYRRCVVLRGSREQTSREARQLLRNLADVLWVDSSRAFDFSVQRWLGRSLQAVCLDLHDGLDADRLGRCHGLIRAGGALVLRMPPKGITPTTPSLTVYPFTDTEVGTRFWRRLERHLDAHGPEDATASLVPCEPFAEGTREQKRVVEQIVARVGQSRPCCMALLAARGRGKSAALGMAIRAYRGHGAKRIVVSGPSRDAVAEVLRFAAPDRDFEVPFFEPAVLAHGDESLDVIMVDEAAQLPVSLLRAMVGRHPGAHFVFSTTTQGYEGTGRGFSLRFLPWLEAQPRPVQVRTLSEPIRWVVDDPLERFIDRLLIFDAELSSFPQSPTTFPQPCRLDRERLATHERLLKSLFGLLVHAHYRTTPSDPQRMLDAPNMAIHAIVIDDRVVAATLVAQEGNLDPATCERIVSGRFRIRGHVLADTLMTHGGRGEVGEFSMVRSVRIATHPSMRHRGLARKLVEHVHASYRPDFFGTVFGATPELLRFRRAVGYELVRVGASLGARTGEPAAVMIRSVSSRAFELLRALRQDLARQIDMQLELLRADGDVGFDASLPSCLREGLEAPRELSKQAINDGVTRYLHGPQTFQGAVYVITRAVEQASSGLSVLPEKQRKLIESRVLCRKGWADAARDAGYPTVSAAMRALRPALRALLKNSLGER